MTRSELLLIESMELNAEADAYARDITLIDP